jgi:hypothetical protein
VTYNGGTDWFALGTGFPLVAVWQLDIDWAHRVLAAGTHGRGAFDLIDSRPPFRGSSSRRSTRASPSARRAT